MRKIVIIIIALVVGMSVSAQKKKQNNKSQSFKYVKSYLNQPAPPLVVREWSTEIPDTTGKFILFEVYGTHCPPCWEAIPKLNAFHAKYKDADYYKGVDKEGTTYNALQLKFVPWALLIDKNRIVRWEGSPNDLTDEIITKILKKYRKKKGKK